jgi:hypothetical protein
MFFILDWIARLMYGDDAVNEVNRKPPKRKGGRKRKR